MGAQWCPCWLRAIWASVFLWEILGPAWATHLLPAGVAYSGAQSKWQSLHVLSLWQPKWTSCPAQLSAWLLSHVRAHPETRTTWGHQVQGLSFAWPKAALWPCSSLVWDSPCNCLLRASQTSGQKGPLPCEPPSYLNHLLSSEPKLEEGKSKHIPACCTAFTSSHKP